MTDTIQLLADIEAYVTERNAAFESGDIAWAKERIRTLGPPADTNLDELALDTFHRARWLCAAISRERRFESQKYLDEHEALDPFTGKLIKVGDPLPSIGSSDMH